MKQEVTIIQSIDCDTPGRCPGKTHGSRGAVPSLTAEKYMKDYRGGLVVDKHEGYRAADPWPRKNKRFRVRSRSPAGPGQRGARQPASGTVCLPGAMTVRLPSMIGLSDHPCLLTSILVTATLMPKIITQHNVVAAEPLQTCKDCASAVLMNFRHCPACGRQQYY